MLPLVHLPTNTTASADEFGTFFTFSAEEAKDRHIFPVGEISGLQRFTYLHRNEPFWMTAKASTTVNSVVPETQFLMAQLESGQVAVLVPLIDGPIRCSLEGSEQGLMLVAESGDPGIVATQVTGLYVAQGDDPYELIPLAAKAVMAGLETGRLRRDKPVPDFIDWFGWCTWDAFYQDVSHEKVREGLESFRNGGVEPKLLILDDGWQSVRKMPSGENRLSAFEANEKFPGDLAPTVQMAKEEFSVETFLVWHAFQGYWGGTDMPGYGVRSIARNASPGIRVHQPGVDQWWGPVAGIVPPSDIYRLYQDYHRHLRKQGVDGVKVDNQAAIETTSATLGGRVHVMQRYHEALEGSVHTHFAGNLINCMSCSNEMLYSALSSNLTRTSTDFWPNIPESHGLHLYVNAQVSAWFGEFVHPDWDMFQSGHPMGAFHAAGRAVSGSPVYVSDKPGVQDFDLLRKLVLPDGSVLRCADPGRPSRDCLFHDPINEDVLLKIFNMNADGGVLGVFNCRYAEGGDITLSGVVRPSDVEGLVGDSFAVYGHNSGRLVELTHDGELPISLPQLQYEVVTIVAITEGFAPIGLVEKFNSNGAVLARSGGNILLRAGGRFLVWAAQKPSRVMADGDEVDFRYDATTHALSIDLPQRDLIELSID